MSAESLIDAQIGYAVQNGPLKGLSFSLSGTNLTDEPFVLNNLDTDPYNLIKYQEYGAVYARGRELRVRLVPPFARGRPPPVIAGGGLSSSTTSLRS